AVARRSVILFERQDCGGTIMFKRTLTAAALGALLAASAFAQTSPPTHAAPPAPETKFVPIPSGQNTETLLDQSTGKANRPIFLQAQDANDWRGSKLIGASVYGPDNASIGEISDVLVAK